MHSNRFERWLKSPRLWQTIHNGAVHPLMVVLDAMGFPRTADMLHDLTAKLAFPPRRVSGVDVAEGESMTILSCVEVHTDGKTRLVAALPLPKQGPNRDDLGELVRQVWVKWAKEQPNPKPSHLLPYDQLPEEHKEVDRRIGVALYLMGRTSMMVELDPGHPSDKTGPSVAWGHEGHPTPQPPSENAS